jgi:tungstate transport system substrate-binding protein
MTRVVRCFAAGCMLLGAAALPAAAQQQFITVASTTSTEESGLFRHLLPAFTKETGIEVRVVAVGTGQALKIGERGDCDVVFVHDKPAELAFVERGFGVDHHEVMHNDFVLVGPTNDPAHADGGKDIVDALRKIASAKAPFVRAATIAARAKQRSAYGKKRALIPKQQAEAGIATPVREWVRP